MSKCREHDTYKREIGSELNPTDIFLYFQLIRLTRVSCGERERAEEYKSKIGSGRTSGDATTALNSNVFSVRGANVC